MTTFKVTVKATSITVYPGEEASCLLQPLINLLTYEDEYVEETKTLGYMYDQETDLLHFHKGIDLNYLRRLLINVEFIDEPYHPYGDMEFEYDEIIPPRNDEQVDVINFICGQNHHSSNLNNRQLFLVKDPGFGKAEPYSRKIPTPTQNGYKLMGEIQPGDYVFDRYGLPTLVTDVFDQGEQDVYRITFADGRSAYCTIEHLWAVYTNNESDRCEVMSLYEIMKHDYTYRYSIPVCEMVQYREQNVLLDPWVFGCFIASEVIQDNGDLVIKTMNETIPRRISDTCSYLIHGCRRDKNEPTLYRFFKRTGEPVTIYEMFRPNMLALLTNECEKMIPDEYLYNNMISRLSLVRGIMDMDGFICKFGQIQYSSKSKTLAKQIQWIMYSIGCTAKVFENHTDSDIYSVLCSIRNSIKPYILSNYDEQVALISSGLYEQPHQYDRLVISGIELVGREMCRCIKVNNPEHLYLTEDFIVTHNTYCSSVGMCKFGVKTLIIMHRDSLRKQWLNSLYNMAGLSSRDVHEITDSEELYEIAHNQHDFDYDVYLMTHATFRAGLKRIGNLRDVGNISKNLKIGFKIIDEAHLEFRSTLLMDFVFNVMRNLYLTATDGRSSKEENSIFKHAFYNTVFYKPSSLLVPDDKPKKWVEYVTVEVNSHCPVAVYKYRVAGGRGMNSASYGKWVIARDKKQTHFKVCRELLRLIYERDDKAKVLVFMPLIDLCSEAAYFFSQGLNYDETFEYDLNIKTINSSNTKSENEFNKRADVIVTTIGSCGTGTDIPGITDIICCSPIVSKITVTQIFGRIRYCGKTCHYYDIIDSSIEMDRFWHRSRMKTFSQLAMKVDFMTWQDDEQTENNK